MLRNRFVVVVPNEPGPLAEEVQGVAEGRSCSKDLWDKQRPGTGREKNMGEVLHGFWKN